MGKWSPFPLTLGFLMNRLTTQLILALFLILSFARVTKAKGPYPFTDLNKLQESLNFKQFYRFASTAKMRRVRIAILDQGFKGWEQAKGKSLPADTRLFSDITSESQPDVDAHGVGMAHVIMALLTDEGNLENTIPQIDFYNARGWNNLKWSVDQIAALPKHRQPDIILFAQVYALGNNWDGKGAINKKINELAGKKHILWVNAAGNYGRTSYEGIIHHYMDNWVSFYDPSPTKQNEEQLEIECPRRKDVPDFTCDVKIELSWNEFNFDDFSKSGTDTDLDLFLFKEASPVHYKSSEAEQVKIIEKEGQQVLPVERIKVELEPGKYYLRVRDNSPDLFGRTSRLRITVDSPRVIMPAYNPRETLFNPADNPNVLTVGTSDSHVSSISYKLKKPELFTPSKIDIIDDNPYGAEKGTQFFGSNTSTAAAIVAAGAAAIKTIRPHYNKKILLSLLKQDYIKSSVIDDFSSLVGAGLDQLNLQFSDTTGGRGYELIPFDQIPYPMSDLQYNKLDNVLGAGKWFFAKTSEGPKIFTTVDVYHHLYGTDMGTLKLQQPELVGNERLVILPDGMVQLFGRKLPMDQSAVGQGRLKFLNQQTNQIEYLTEVVELPSGTKLVTKRQLEIAPFAKHFSFPAQLPVIEARPEVEKF